MKEIYVIMCEFAYRMVNHYDKKFKKWCNVFHKYADRLEEL